MGFSTRILMPVIWPFDDQGRIIIYDFGMMGEISASQRAAIAGCVTAVIEKDGENIVPHLIELGVLKEDANRLPIIRTLRPFIDYYSGKSVRDLDFTDLERDIDQIALERALRLPANLAYLLRAGSSLEGIARTLQPNFSFVEAAKPFIQKWLLREPTAFGPLLKFFMHLGKEAYRNNAAKWQGAQKMLKLGAEKQRPNNGLVTTGRALPDRQRAKKKTDAELTEPAAAKPDPSKNGAKAAPGRPDDRDGDTQKATDITLTKANKSRRSVALSQESSLPEAKAAGNRHAVDQNDQTGRQQLYFLETKLTKSLRLQVTLSISSLSVIMLFLLQTFLPGSGSYATYFLIGNGVMGAIIMWHLVEAVHLGKTFQDRR